jgi:hypothetical protein
MMKKAVTVEVAHRLGRDEALRRARERAEQLRTEYGHWVQATEEVWLDDRGEFKVGALGQTIRATVCSDHESLRLTIELPLLLALLANPIQAFFQTEGTRLVASHG